MNFDFMLVYEGFFLKKCDLFQLFQFAKSELEQDLVNRAKPQVNREKSCSNFFGTNWNRPRNPWRTSSSPADSSGGASELF